MRQSKFTVIVVTLVGIILAVSINHATAAVIFTSGWENSPGQGCTAPSGQVDAHITDNFNWDADHSPNPCSAINPTTPSMSVVTSPVHTGNYAFRYTCPDQAWQPNGPGGVILKSFAPANELYIRYYVMWSSNFRFLGADYKSTFAHYSGGHTYNSYYGKEGDPLHGRLRFFFSGGSSVAPWSTNVTLNLGQWHCIEWHLKAGGPGVGFVEAKVDGTLVQWTSGGTRHYVSAGESVGNFTSFSLDNTINPYYDNSFPNAISGNAYIYYDDVVINNGDGWIGPTGGSSPVAGLTPPSNFRIQQ